MPLLLPASCSRLFVDNFMLQKSSISHKIYWAGLSEVERTLIISRRRGRVPWNKGRVCTEAEREAMRTSARTRSPESKFRSGEANRRNASRISATIRAGWQNPEIRERHRLGNQSEAYKQKGKTIRGLVWINNGITSRRIRPDDLIEEGWKLGKTHNLCRNSNHAGLPLSKGTTP